ncbi:MFS transporter [Gryllotalpicola koreensis]|uniref:MFS transporter n=1 Tax=Gryllotalpicola koreensis TaxID=993086 RepID=A0ABP8A7K0_9MICO
MTQTDVPIDAASSPIPRGRPGRGAALLSAYVGIGLLLIALNLRIGVASVSPVLSSIRRGLGVSASTASLLTTIPVFAFGAFAFLTPVLISRLGLHRLLGLTMAAAAAGIGIRMIDSPVALFAGTVLVGAAIAVGNVCMPTAIKRDFAHRAGLMMGLYTTALFVGGALAAAFTVPLEAGFHGSWRDALGFWAVPAVIAFLVWVPRMLRSPGRVPNTHRVLDGTAELRDEPSLRRLLRDRVAWAVTGFMGLQSLTYYGGLTWIPTMLQDAGTSAHTAGVLLSYSSLPGVVAALAVPAMHRARPTWLIVAVSTLLCIAGFAGMLVSSTGELPWLWMTLLGLGQGAAIALALGYIVQRAPDAQHTGHLSTMAQGIGYLFAGFGPLGLGVLHTATDGWGIPIAALVVLLLAQFVTGAGASRERHVLRP